MNVVVDSVRYLTGRLSQRCWLHDVEHMTHHLSGSIYWKGQLIDFIRDPEHIRYQEYIQDLVIRCRHLEAIHVPIHIETVVHLNHWFSTMTNDYRYKPLLMSCPDIRVSGKSKIIVIQGYRIAEYRDKQWTFYCKNEDQSDSDWSYWWGQASLIHRGYNDLPLAYSDLNHVNSVLEHFDVPVDLFD